MKIYLDDIRPSPDGWTAARSFSEFQRIVTTNDSIEAISFDHDLGETGPDGYEAVQWLAANHPELFSGQVKMDSHSANPVGRENIEAYIASCQRNREALLEYKNRQAPQ